MVAFPPWLGTLSMALAAVYLVSTATDDGRPRREERLLLSGSFGALVVGDIVPGVGLLTLGISVACLIGVAVVAARRL